MSNAVTSVVFLSLLMRTYLDLGGFGRISDVTMLKYVARL